MLNLRTKEISGKEKIFQIDLKGILDSTTSDSFISFVHEKIHSGIKRFIVDCKSLSYITSSGISTLIRLNNELVDKKTALVYSHLNSEVKSLFSLFGFNKKFLVADDNISAEKILQNLFLPKSDSKEESEVEFGKYKNVEFSFNNPIRGNEENHANEPKSQDAKEEPESAPVPSVDIKTNPTDWVRTAAHSNERDITSSLLEKMKSIQTDVGKIKTEPIKEPDSLSEKIYLPLVLPKFEFHESVFHCESCGKVIRVVKPGKHQCPSCESIFTVRPSGAVTYLEKLT